VTYPARLPSPARRSAPAAWDTLTFAPLAAGAFPAYDAVRAAAEAGGNRGTVINAADEAAVAGFLDGRIGFPDIATTIAAAIDRWGDDREPTLDEIVALDAEVRVALSEAAA
jgi:1-deoxy-D-xylulose-5-phosphate reductoisomerase